MGRSDSERAPVLSAMLPSVSARGSAAAVRPPNVVDLTSPRAYAVSPGPDQTWPLDGGEAAIRGLSTVEGEGSGVGGPGAGELGLALVPLPLEGPEPLAEELEEGDGQLETPPRRGLEAADGRHAGAQARLDLGEHPVAREHGAVPGVGLHDVDVAARAPLALLADEVRPGQVAHGTGDRCRADVEGLGELRRRH